MTKLARILTWTNLTLNLGASPQNPARARYARSAALLCAVYAYKCRSRAVAAVAAVAVFSNTVKKQSGLWAFVTEFFK